MVFKSQNTFIERTQMLDVVVLANEAINSTLKGDNCVAHKVDIEKA